jgi:hypothetical protein
MIAYFGVFAVIGYTDDAYIRSDLVRIAPEVSGPVAAVHAVRTGSREVALGRSMRDWMERMGLMHDPPATC